MKRNKKQKAITAVHSTPPNSRFTIRHSPFATLPRFWSIGVALLSVVVAIGWTALQLNLPADGYSGNTSILLGSGFAVRTDLVATRPTDIEANEERLQAKDIVIAAGGHTIEEWLRAILPGQRLPHQEWHVGATIPYTILRSGQEQTLSVRLIRLSLKDIVREGLNTYLFNIFVLALTVLVVIQRPRETVTHLVLLGASAAVVLQTHEVIDRQVSLMIHPAIFWGDVLLEHLSVWFCYTPLTHASLTFPEKKRLIQQHPVLLWLTYLIYPISTLMGVILGGPTLSGRLVGGERASMLAMSALSLVMVASIGHSLATARHPKSRSQIRWIAWGVTIGMLPLVLLDLLPLALFRRPILPYNLVMLPLFLVPLSAAIAIVRHNLFDVEVIINRSLVYSTLTVLLGGLYVALVRLLTLVVQTVIPVGPAGNETLVVFVATLTIALAFAPLRRWIQMLIDRTFYRTKLDYQRLLPEMITQLSTNIVMERLAPLLTEELPLRLQINGASLLVLDSEGHTLCPPLSTPSEQKGQQMKKHSLPVAHPLAEHLRHSGQPLLRSDATPHLPDEASAFLQEGVELSIPLIVGERLVGVYNLGAKLSGIPYSRDEVQLLTVLGQQAAVSLENARLYQDIEEYSRTLEKRVEERTRQLQRYAAELEQSNKETRQFAYVISHDMRAPLVNLKGFAAELRYATERLGPVANTVKPHLDEEQRQNVIVALEEDVPEALDFIESSVTRLDDLINALLKLSRLGHRELELEPIDMNALVQATLQTIAHPIAEHQVKVTVSRLPEVVADRTSMEQIIGDILSNAVKYLSKDRPGEIKITAKHNGDETIFRIWDNGRGIAEENMDKVFAPFRRAGRQDIPGEGMGLAYVQTLVRRHGGRIWCESELGTGTTFTFTISDHLAKGDRYV